MKTKTARALALETLYRVEMEGVRADVHLSRSFRALKGDAREKALARELCSGVLRWRLKLDYALSRFCRESLDKLNPWIRNILRLGAYQLLYLDRIPDWAALDESVKLAHRYGHRGTAGLVNGVLRSVSRERENIEYPPLSESALRHIAVEHSHPEWLVKRWMERLGVEKTIAVCESNNQLPTLTVRANLLKTTPDGLTQALKSEGLRVVPCKYAANGLRLYGCGDPSKLEAFREGLFQVQDEASMLTAQLLAPHQGMRILDCCAGLGGKATLMAEAMHNRGLVVALDINRDRLSMMVENCGRLGIDVIHPAVMDSAGRSELCGFFDAVMVDAPCSDLGVLHKHPEIKWKRRQEDLTRLQELQLKILENAGRFVKPGGVLFYSTCTVEPEENQEVMSAYLAAHAGFEPEDAGSFLPAEARQFITPEGFFLTFPQREGMDGFFAVRLRKSREGS
jgi:16S rRNA (cytosine967-C5)-methyltransferase